MHSSIITGLENKQSSSKLTEKFYISHAITPLSNGCCYLSLKRVGGGGIFSCLNMFMTHSNTSYTVSL